MVLISQSLFIQMTPRTHKWSLLILILGQAVKLATTLERDILLLFLIPKECPEEQTFYKFYSNLFNLNQNVFKFLSLEKPWPIRHVNCFLYWLPSISSNKFPVSGKNQTQIRHISLNLNSIPSHLLFFPLEEAKQAFKKENLPYRYFKKCLWRKFMREYL